MNLQNIIAKVKNFAAKDPNKVRDGIDKAEAAINSKTGNKYADKVKQGGDAVEDQLGVSNQQTPKADPPAQATQTNPQV